MVDQKDVVISMMGAAATFAGVVLVVLGLAFTIPSGAKAEERYSRQIVTSSCQLVFTYNVISVILSGLWLMFEASLPLPTFFYGLVTLYFLATLLVDIYLVVRGPELLVQQ